MRRLAPVVILVLVALAFAVGRGVREGLGIEPSLAAIQAWVVGLGWKGYVGLVGALIFRQFLLLHSAVLLTVGGLSFGVALGTALGALGVTLSAAMMFVLARLAGREWVERRMRGRALGEVEHLGPVVVGVVTAHPAGPLSLFHGGAGLSPMSAAGFLIAVALGAPIRAFIFSLFGSALLDTSSPSFLIASAVLLLVVVAPLAHPGVRRWAFRRAGRDG